MYFCHGSKGSSAGAQESKVKILSRCCLALEFKIGLQSPIICTFKRSECLESFLQGEAGTGNVVEAVKHCRAVMGAIKSLQAMDDDELYVFAKEIRAPIELVRQVPSIFSAPDIEAGVM